VRAGYCGPHCNREQQSAAPDFFPLAIPGCFIGKEKAMVGKVICVAGFLVLAAVSLAGCERPYDSGPAEKPATVNAPEAKAEAKKEEEHGHKPGAHGGIMVSLGRDSYHAEAVFEKGGKVRLYMLGKEESRVHEVDVQDLQAFAKADGDAEAVAIQFEPEPQPGDSPAKTSLFIALLPPELASRKVEVTVPSIRIGSERFRLGFASTTESHEADMPAGVDEEAARELYLKAGGLYTEADIKANGNMTVNQKYKGFRSKHDMHPKPGDKICPVTLTKANAQCTWIVGGKTYEFCCPPCVDEFVLQAKQNPAAIKEPHDYVKKQ